MRLGIYGGTFDPVHIGHLVLAESARTQLDLARVLFVPAGDPWRKSRPAITPAEQRFRMIELAIADNPGLGADDSELLRKGPSYTAETLREFSAKADELFFLLGEDALQDLPYWRKPEEIVRYATLAVAERDGADADHRALPEGTRLARLDMPLLAVSSTEIRRRVREGLSIRYLVPADVEAYIRENQLYIGSAES